MRIGTYPIRGALKPECVYGTFQFAVNGTSNPLTSTFTGSLAKVVASVVYSATGKFTITFQQGFSFAPTPVVGFDAVCADQTATNFFQTCQIGAYNQSSPSAPFVVVGCTNSSGAFAPPANAGNLISMSFEGVNSSGK
jgi:hypothetical protein